MYDQQSSTNEFLPFPGTGTTIQDAYPVGQSFTPALASVGFVRLILSDQNPTNGAGATLYVNVRTESVTGTVLGSSLPVMLDDGALGTANFLFPDPVAVNPGSTYYFDVMVQSGDFWRIENWEYHYQGGIAFYRGTAFPSSDIWFREGIIVPEPRQSLLWLLGVTTLASLICLRKRSASKRLGP